MLSRRGSSDYDPHNPDYVFAGDHATGYAAAAATDYHGSNQTKESMMKCTQAQLDALYQIYLRWQDKTVYPIMPTDPEIVPDDDYKDGDYIAVWVGTLQERDNGSTICPGSIYLGVEKDGHTHS